MSDRVQIARLRIGDIPALTFCAEGATDRPTIFYMHGFGGCKEHGIDFGYRLPRHEVTSQMLDDACAWFSAQLGA